MPQVPGSPVNLKLYRRHIRTVRHNLSHRKNLRACPLGTSSDELEGQQLYRCSFRHDQFDMKLDSVVQSVLTSSSCDLNPSIGRNPKNIFNTGHAESTLYRSRPAWLIAGESHWNTPLQGDC